MHIWLYQKIINKIAAAFPNEKLQAYYLKTSHLNFKASVQLFSLSLSFIHLN